MVPRGCGTFVISGTRFLSFFFTLVLERSPRLTLFTPLFRVHGRGCRLALIFEISVGARGRNNESMRTKHRSRRQERAASRIRRELNKTPLPPEA